MDTLLHDLRFGLKLLWKEKAFSATVLLTLAVCIGANATIFSVVNTVLLRPLPYDDPQELLTLFNSYPGAGAERASNGGPDFFFRRERIDALAEVANFQQWGNTLGEAGSTERVQSLRVTSTFLPLLRVSPVLGRNFTWEEMEEGNHRKAILFYHVWQESYGGDPSVLGQDLRVEGEPFTIVGVLPEGFRLAGDNEVRDFILPIPFRPEDQTLERWHSNNYSQIARLAPGATMEQAQAQLDAMNQQLIDEWPVPEARQVLTDAGFHTVIRSAKDDLLRDIRPSLLLLWGGVAFVLLIGCVNIANLMLSRSNVRLREMATRLAMGADRLRLGRQLLTESVLLGLLGGGFGLILGYLGVASLTAFGVEDLPRGTEIGLDGVVVLFTLFLGLGAGVVFGAIPLVNLVRSELNTVFRGESRSGTANRRTIWLRNGLVAGQVAIAFILLIGAGLMLESFRRVLEVDPGLDPQGVVSGNLPLPQIRYPDGEARAQFVVRLLQEIRALPGVASASFTSSVPFGGDYSSSVILPEGYVPQPGESMLSPMDTRVGTDFFETLGIPLLQGRTFDARDHSEAQQVIILDEWLANRYFPQGDAVGKRMLFGTLPGMEEDEEPYLHTIVGVVGSHRHMDLAAETEVGAYYFPYSQGPRPFAHLVMKAEGDPSSLVAPAREVITRLDPELAFFNVRTLEERIDISLMERRTPMLLLSVFALVALFLAGVGIYGALAYTVTQRTREMGIRMAIGSSAGGVFRLVVGQGIGVVVVGLLVGGVGAFLLGRLIESLLYGVQSADPAVMGIVALLLGLTGLSACVLPARRATRIPPAVALTTD